jgi:hypothetical protein
VILNLALWAIGAALIVAGAIKLQAPLGRYRDLKATEANLQRYDSWRGGRRTAAGESSVTGADVMREHLRGQVQRWAVVLVVGVVLVVSGFVVR